VGLSAEEATPVVLIMLECVNNALEHAFPDRPGQITIELSDDGAVRTLIIADDGVGISETATAEPASLGLRIITALTRQVGGQWSLQSAGPGARARLCWPKSAASGLT
jgi:two-component sensor histidine kinase